MPKGDYGIRIEGLEAAERALAELGEESQGRFKDELQKAANQGSDMAAFIAQSKGDVYKGAGDHGDPARHDGDLVQKIAVRRSGDKSYAVVEYSRTRTKKYPGGYPYPRRLEYGPGGRAFMAPMADRMAPLTTLRMERMIDLLIVEKGLE